MSTTQIDKHANAQTNSNLISALLLVNSSFGQDKALNRQFDILEILDVHPE
ncbi:MAG: hypothetical protein H8E34_09365 [Bacteroidetes bacterium]|nr:hypothetical protein [Bacteroidota bacterium]MBL6942856.1 hypothetical protein [Bacteroidales bacterium]